MAPGGLESYGSKSLLVRCMLKAKMAMNNDYLRVLYDWQKGMDSNHHFQITLNPIF